MKGLSRCLVGAGTWLMPRPWRKPRLMKVAYCALRLIERDQKKCQSEQVQDRSLQQGAVVALPKRHLGARVGTLGHCHSSAPSLCRPVASVYHLSCPSFLRELTV